MASASVPARVVREDARLEVEADKSRIELARHRWHWTLDESNARRVTIREYAKQVARGYTTITDMVNGYAEWSDRGAPVSQFSDYLERAKLRGDTLIATEAVADARGISIGTARRHHTREVRAVRQAAADRAERSGTSVAEEAQGVAEFMETGRKARARQDAERRQSHTLRWVEVDGKLASAARYLREALKAADGVPFDDEEMALLLHTVDQVASLTELVKLRVGGAVNVDWDAELTKLSSENEQ